MHTNRLSQEKSPYLLQHAHNPVDWYAWGPEAFEKARSEDKPIFLSIGYSTCHWCHVMERESFESEEVAQVLNRHFIPIKVDREERPDVDRIYMMFVQATTGSGGWPMSVWLTPDLKPFFGGTYFPPDNRYGRPGFRSILEYLAQAWMQDRSRILQSSVEVLDQLKQYTEVRAGGNAWMDEGVFDSCFYTFRRSYDGRFGGFGPAPKFPRPVAYNFLFRYGQRTKTEEATDMALHTLKAMAHGGMNDQIGGGFHRYSVDERWFVSHFEKMLYDQAQLAISYLEAYQITGDPFYAGIARQILDYVLRDMTHPDGGFYSAEDADSVIDPAHPHEKGEGAFYIWPQREIEELLGQPVAQWFSYRYGVEANGNVREDPHGEFTGRNVLFEAHTVEETASRFGEDAEHVRGALEGAKATLLQARARRIRPHLDDKILTAWNGLMISAFAKGAQVLDEPRYRLAARRAADFIVQRLYQPTSGILLRRFRDGEAAVEGFLDDYAFFAQALIDLYETEFMTADLTLARQITETQIGLFEDAVDGAFFSTTRSDASLVLRIKEDYDGAEPSGNSVAVLNLLRLASYLGQASWQEKADRALLAFMPRMQAAANAVPQMLTAFLFSRSKPKQIILAGSPGATDTNALLRAVRRRFVPHATVLLLDGETSRGFFAEAHPELHDMQPIAGRATAYVCENFACQLPTADVEELARLIE